jgi:hypothetical protein
MPTAAIATIAALVCHHQSIWLFLFLIYPAPFENAKTHMAIFTMAMTTSIVLFVYYFLPEGPFGLPERPSKIRFGPQKPARPKPGSLGTGPGPVLSGHVSNKISFHPVLVFVHGVIRVAPGTETHGFSIWKNCHKLVLRVIRAREDHGHLMFK